MMAASWTRVPSHASSAPWTPPTQQAAKAFPALADATQYARLHSADSVQQFVSALEHRDRPITSLALTPEAAKATLPGVIYGDDLKTAWHDNGKPLPADARLVVFLAHPLPVGKVKLDAAHLDPTQARVIGIAKESDVLRAKAPKNYTEWKDNAARVNRAFFKTPAGRYVWKATLERFGQYFSGAHEGLSLPKNMGLILASLGVTSVTLSAFLYGVLEMADYETVDAKLARLKKQKLEEQQNQLLTQPMVMA